MNLYELTEELKQFKDYAEENTLEQELIQDTLESLEMPYEDKIVGYAYVIKSLEDNVEILKARKKEWAEKQSRQENNIKRMKDAIKDSMEFVGKDKVDNGEVSVRLQNNPHKLVVDDESNISSDYFVEQPKKLDKKKLSDYLKSHPEEGLNGVQLIQEKSVRIK